MLDKLEARMSQLGAALENSAAHHNSLLGALAEAKYLYSVLKGDIPEVQTIVADVAPVIETLDPAIAPAVSTVAEVVANA